MKKLLSLLIMFFVLKTTSGQQNDLKKDEFNYKVIYNLTYQPDSTNVKSQKSEEMVLYIGEGFSRFSSAGQAVGDSLQSAFDYSNFNQAAFKEMRSQIPKTEFPYYIYKGIPEGKLTYLREIAMDKFRYTENKDLFDWKVYEETDTVAGFHVQKATTNFAGRDYTAWFTGEIPFSEGPYKFSGLPGLIVKIQDDKEHYLFELKQIFKLENPVSFAFQKEEFMEISPEKLSKLEEEYKKDPAGFAQRSIPGLKIEYDSEQDRIRLERERKEKLEKENNPIELE